MNKEKSVFEVLASVDVSKFVEKKNNLTYLSWSHAWAETKKRFPNATYAVQKNPLTGQPFWYDEQLGYIVQTIVEIDGLSIPMQLPVLDGANKAMKARPYTYKGTAWVNGVKTTVEKTVDAATMFDINTAIMRCLTKNLALFGLGLHVYAGEDLPLVNSDEQPKEAVKTTPVKKVEPVATPKLNERQQKALAAFKKLDSAKVLKHLVENKLMYATIEEFISKEKIEEVLKVYDKVK